MKNIVETAIADPSFSTLVTALKTAGLVETLSGAGPFTVFAPTDEAFKKLPAGALDTLLKPENKAKLSSVLTYHVVSGKAKAADVLGKSSWKTVEGSEASITSGGAPMIDKAKITKTDIECSNGIIHVIDTVIMPSSMAEAKAA